MRGVELYPLKQINVLNGNVLHALKSTDQGYYGFGEAYFSLIEKGAIKGWKKHTRYVLNIVVPKGTIKFVIYDDRLNSETYGQFEEYVLSTNENYQRITIQPGLWMAFMGLDDTTSILLDIIPEVHDASEAMRVDLSFFNYDFYK